MSTTNVNPTPHEWHTYATARHHFRRCVTCNRAEMAEKYDSGAESHWRPVPHQLPTFSPFFHHACAVPTAQFVLEPTAHLATCS